MRFRPRVAPLLGLAAAVCLVAAASPAHAAGWLPGQPVSAPGEIATMPSVALSTSGDRFVAWVRVEPGTSNELGLAVRFAPAGGDFGPVQLLADTEAEDVSLTAGGDGTAALVWMSGESLHIATRAPGQTDFTEATPFPLGGFATDSPKVVMQGGDVYVTVGTESNSGNVETSAIHVLHLAPHGTAITRVPGSGPDGTLAQVSSPDSPRELLVEPTIALNAGQVHVAWKDELDSLSPNTTSRAAVMRASGPITGPLGAPTTVDTATAASGFAPDMSPVITAGGGHVDIVYVNSAGRIAYRDLLGPGPIQTLANDPGISNLHAALDPAGDLLLAWQAFSIQDDAQGVFSAIVPAGAASGPVVRMTPLNGSRELDDFIVGPDGSALALPDLASNLSEDDVDEQVQASFRDPGSGFGSLETVSGPQDQTARAELDHAAGALGSGGRAVVVWAANDGSGTRNERIFISERDGTPPVLNGVSVPARAAVQTPVQMSAAAVDSQSNATVRWDFGDGSQAAGAAVAHAYGQAGIYAVTITATDGFGNSSTQTHLIAVTGPAAPSDHTPPPVISALRTAHKRFAVAPRNTAQIAARRTRGAHGTAAGTIFSLRLSERATLVFSLTRVRGHLTPPPFVRAGRGPGTVAIPFSGRIGGVRLSPGAYRMTAVAIDPAGNRSRPATVTFTIVSR